MTLPGPPHSGSVRGLGERREHGTGRLGSAPVRPTARQAGRQQAAGRQQRAAVGGEPPGRQAGLGN